MVCVKRNTKHNRLIPVIFLHRIETYFSSVINCLLHTFLFFTAVQKGSSVYQLTEDLWKVFVTFSQGDFNETAQQQVHTLEYRGDQVL